MIFIIVNIKEFVWILEDLKYLLILNVYLVEKKIIKIFLNEKIDCYDLFFKLSKEFKVELVVED